MPLTGSWSVPGSAISVDSDGRNGTDWPALTCSTPGTARSSASARS